MEFDSLCWLSLSGAFGGGLWHCVAAHFETSVECRKGVSVMGKLVLSRKINERIELFDPGNESFGVIVITQGKIRGNKSSISIEAPDNVRVKRAELATTVATEPC